LVECSNTTWGSLLTSQVELRSNQSHVQLTIKKVYFGTSSQMPTIEGHHSIAPNILRKLELMK